MPTATPLTETTKAFTSLGEGSKTAANLREQGTPLVPPFIPGPNAIPSSGTPDLTPLSEL